MQPMTIEQVDDLTLTEIINSACDVDILDKKAELSLGTYTPNKYLHRALLAKRPEKFQWFYQKALRAHNFDQVLFFDPKTELLSCLRVAVSTGDKRTVECVFNIAQTSMESVVLTPDIFQLCARNGYLDILKFFYDHSHTLSAKDNSDIFMLAAGYGHLNIVKWMLTSVDDEKCTIEIDFDLIARLEQYEVLEWLFLNYLKNEKHRTRIKKELFQSLKNKEPRQFDNSKVEPLERLSLMVRFIDYWNS